MHRKLASQALADSVTSTTVPRKQGSPKSQGCDLVCKDFVLPSADVVQASSGSGVFRSSRILRRKSSKTMSKQVAGSNRYNCGCLSSE
ncbi:hypothetical protein ABBQ38_012603 [Trebouxia sp. C0009 RCD-2024]